MSYKNLRNVFLIIFSIKLAALLVTVNLLRVSAAGGANDPTFRNDGSVRTIMGGNAFANDIAIQTDGKIIVVGDAEVGGASFALARYSTTGFEDSLFDTDGKVITPIGDPNDSVEGHAVALQSNGRIVVCGEFYDGQTNIAFIVLARYHTSGQLDITFDTDGIVFTGMGGAGIRTGCNDVTLQSDDKVVIAAYSTDVGSGQNWHVLRYNSNGSLDPTFDGDGMVTTDFGTNFDIPYSVSIQSDGRIIAGGRTLTDFALARYNTNGSLDGTFDGDGKTTADLSGAIDVIHTIKLQTDGKIVAGGRTGSSFSFGLARFNLNGSLDTTFDGDGKVITNVNPSGNDQIEDVTLQFDGKIVVAGHNGNDFILVRYNVNGSLDTSFAQGGILIRNFGLGSERATGILIQLDGKLVVCGWTGSSTSDFLVARYLPDVGGGANFDYDADERADVSLFRPSNSTWYLLQSTAGFTGATFGSAGDLIAPADYDGDAKIDLAVFRPSIGTWYLLRSQLGFTAVAFGVSGDRPMPADFDGDGKADIAVFRPSNGYWYIQASARGLMSSPFGTNGDVPVAADYDKDGVADIAVFRPSNGTWHQFRSATFAYVGVGFGQLGDKPVPGDYDGDGETDPAVYRPSNGTWYLLRSTEGFTNQAFGANGDLPAPADFDADGKTDIAVFRPANGTWYLLQTTSGFAAVGFGVSGDNPTPSAYIP